MFDGGALLDWTLDPLEVLARWPAERTIIMLHSGRPDANWSRYSVIAEATDAIRFEQRQTRLSKPDHALYQGFEPTHRPLNDLRQIHQRDAGRSLWLGSFSYDLGRHIEHLPQAPPDDRGWPTYQLERCEGWLVYDNLNSQWTAHGSYAQQVPTLMRQDELHATDPTFHAGPIESDQCRNEVQASIQRVIDYIASGDVFQVNLAQRFSGPFAGNPRAFYAALCEQSPAWYGAYGELTRFDGNEPQRTFASISPELFLSCDMQGRVTTRPIKGTRPGDVNPCELEQSDKDRAELAMIVDLMRNDLGRVCSYGSVFVNDPRAIESHPTVHHGVATITGQLHPSKDLFDLLHATFPGGSITGAPKVRAMQIIDELEPAQRGPYCGAIGMIHGNAMRLSIAIRTVMIQQQLPGGEGGADVWAGGGIVADSDPDSEYQEMLDKAKAMRDALTHVSSVCSG